MGAHATFARMLVATRALPLVERRAVEPNHRLHAILDRSSATWTQSEAAYVAECEARAEAMERSI